MGFLRKIAEQLFGGRSSEIRDPDGIYLYVKCSRCGAPVRVRADRRHDLQRDYDTGEYILRKEIMDGGCFALIQTTTRFNAAYKIIDQQIEGGEFISGEEYRKLAAPSVAQDEQTETPAQGG